MVIQDFTQEELDALCIELADSRRIRGLSVADAAWIERALGFWLDHISGKRDDVDRSSIAQLAVGMQCSLAMRDALIVSLLFDQDACSRKSLVAFASRPHSPTNVRSMNRLLTRAFEDDEVGVNVERCARGLRLLAAMVDTMPAGYRIQPLATASYVTWWTGGKDAVAFARDALELDQGCSLAAIVCSAVDRGVSPAWLKLSVA